MRHAGGYAQIFGGKGTFACFEPGKPFVVSSDQHEVDTWGCVHCNKQVHAPVQKQDTEYFFCRNCMGRICDTCADQPCIPFMKKIEAQEERTRRLRAYGG